MSQTQRIGVQEYQAAVKSLLENVFDTLEPAEELSLEINEFSHSPAALNGRIIAKDLRSKVSVPAFDNSQMDGFAYHSADLAGKSVGQKITLPLTSMVAAGDLQSSLEAGTAAPIMTGAPIPSGADCVIAVEETNHLPFGEFKAADFVEFELSAAHLEPGRYIRKAGSDTEQGEIVARAGQVLNPRLIGHLASAGIKTIPVKPKLKAVVVSTGSELLSADENHGQIFDANGPSIATALSEIGIEVVDTLRIGDDASLVQAAVAKSLAKNQAHLVVSTGGVSAGAKEPIRQLAALGHAITFHKVAMQPGGPQGLGWFESNHHKAAWIALPGNPVSCLLSIDMFVRLAMGYEPRLSLRLPISTDYGQPLPSPAGLLQIRRARIMPNGRARIIGGPGSHLLAALAKSNAYVIVPAEQTEISDSEVLEVRVLN